MEDNNKSEKEENETELRETEDREEKEEEREEEKQTVRNKRKSLLGNVFESDLFDEDDSPVGHIKFDAIFSPTKRKADEEEEEDEEPKSKRAGLKSGFELRLSLSLGEASPKAKRSGEDSSRKDKSDFQSSEDEFFGSKSETEEDRASKASDSVKTQKKLHQEAKAKFEISINLSGEKDNDKEDKPGFKFTSKKKGKGINTQREQHIGIPGPITAAKSIANKVSSLYSKFKGPGSKKSEGKGAGSSKEGKGQEIEMQERKSSGSDAQKGKK